MPDSDDDLRDALTDIHGIGDAKADAILETIDEHTTIYIGEESVGQITDVDIVADNVRQAADYHDADDHEYAAKFVRQADDALDEE